MSEDSSGSRSTRSTGATGASSSNYTDTRGNTVVAEYRRSSTNSLRASTTERVLLRISQPFANHNGGMLAFGPDGYLYIGVGDGGSAGDPGNRAQSTATRLGKLLRIDVDHRSGSLQLREPAVEPVCRAERARRDLGNRTPEPVAVLVRPADRRPLDRRRRPGPDGRRSTGRRRPAASAVARTTGGGSSRVGPATTLRRAARGRAARCRSRCTRTTSAVRSPAGTSTAARATRRWPAATCSATTVRGASGRCRRPVRRVQSPRLLLDSSRSISSFGQGDDGTLYLTDIDSGEVYRVVAAFR